MVLTGFSEQDAANKLLANAYLILFRAQKYSFFFKYANILGIFIKKMYFAEWTLRNGTINAAD